MSKFDSAALLAAAQSAARKSESGDSSTDLVRPVTVPRRRVISSVDLTTNYLGMELRNPLVASAGPLSQTVDGILELADAGVGAIVLFSLFEEQIRAEQLQDTLLVTRHEGSFAEALTYFPIENTRKDYTEHYLRLLEAAASAIDVPLIASLNGSTRGGWIDLAQRMVDAGASAIELNIYFVPGDLQTPGAEVEARHVEIMQDVKACVDVPVSVKLSPYFSSTGAMIKELDEAGADGFVLFNRFLQPDVDPETGMVQPDFELSIPNEGRLPRTWIASLFGKVNGSLAGSSGVETSADVLRYLMAGADVVMTTTALVRHGRGYAAELLAGVEDYLTRTGLTLDEVRGMAAQPKLDNANAYARSGYIAALEKAKRQYGRI